MGSLRNLTKGELNVHLVHTSSNLVDMYVYDILKGKCGATRDSIFEVNSRKSFENMLELVNMQPFLADKWLFVIEYGKVKKQLSGKQSIFRVDTSEFILKVKNYKDFKEAKELLSNSRDLLNDMYLSYMNFYDVEYLLNGKGLSEKLISFVYRSYSSDPEQILVLLRELESGRVIDSRKQISDICGVSTGSLNSFAISLLGTEPKQGKGQKTVIKNRIKVATELAEVYGYGKMRNFLTACVKDILDIKTLHLNGIIYDRIENIPDIELKDSVGNSYLVFDEKRLYRYKNHLETIKEIPYNKILRLYLMLKKSGRWYKDSDMINFIYQYYMKGDL